jgi:stalled ribosome rescue protein Dom34
LRNWEHIIDLYENGKREEAVKALLEMDDDVYFLRFMLKYGKGLLKDLTRQTSSKVLQHILTIKKTNFMEQLFFKLVS